MSNTYLFSDDTKMSCFFCREIKGIYKHSAQIAGDEFICPHCGYYQITREVLNNLHRGYEFRAQATSIAQEKKIKGLDNYVLEWRQIPDNDNEHQICVNNVPFLNYYPEDYLEKMDHILLNIGRQTHFSPLENLPFDYHDFGLFYVIPPYEYYDGEMPSNDARVIIENKIIETLKILEQMGWIRLSNAYTPQGVFLTVDGLKHLRELHSNVENNRQVFVAMWYTNNEAYSNDLKKYVSSIEEAVKIAGYSVPCIPNQEKYNGPIMNRVINEINQSRFLIADLTCDKKGGMRGGVYYEAGLAEGRKMPVILTCSKKAHDDNLVHFYLKQFNTILWYIDDNGVIRADGYPKEDFSQYVADWIIKTVGKV